MTYDELLDIIDFDEGMGEDSKSFNALRAVVELHKPIVPEVDWCYECTTKGTEPVYYPCPTLKAIEKELK